MVAPAQNLLDILTLESIEENLFRGSNEDGRVGRLFGGQVLAQALRAASSTVAERYVHSLHGYFLRAGDSQRPVLYEVERIRDGSSFATRRVVAIQNGAAICNVDVSFQVDEPGLSHEDAMPNVPLPEMLTDDRLEGRGERPFESRPVYGPRQRRSPREQFWNPMWLRFRVSVPPDDRLLAACLLAYASDMGMVATSVIPHAGEAPDLQLASLDHALWIHRPFAIDDWLLFVKRTTSASSARGMNQAEFFDRSGRLVASVSQEGLMRPRRS